jgi:hypothetical protein
MKKALPQLEKIFMAALIVGALLNYFEIENGVLINISLGGLGITFFLLAFETPDTKPPTEDATEKSPLGFKDLLGVFMIPKVLRIGSAVGIIGILLYRLDFGNDGYKQMLGIGGSTILMCILILTYLKITGTNNLDNAIKGLFKSIPILFFIYYILYL